MRVRMEVVATAGLLIVPLAAVLLLGPADDRAREPTAATDSAPAVRATVTSDLDPAPRPVKRAPTRGPKPKPRAVAASRPAPADEPEEREDSDRLWPEAREFDEDSPAGRAKSLFQEKQYAEAILTAQSCLAQEPDNESCKNTLLRTYLKTGAYREARKQIGKCLDANPDDVTCLGHQMGLHLKRGRSDEARAVAERIVELAPDSAWGRSAALYVRGADGKPKP